MYYKIYLDNIPVFLLASLDQDLIRQLDQSRILYVNECSPEVIQQTLAQVKEGKADAVVFYHEDVDLLKAAFWKQFTVIQAAGGLVANEKEEVLFIFRRGRWDLPKGKLDPPESLESCALREVEEETGLQPIRLGQFLVTTYHVYRQDEEEILKETSWYRMTADSRSTLTAQTDEDITQAEWLGKPMLPMVYNNTYQAIRDVVNLWV